MIKALMFSTLLIVSLTGCDVKIKRSGKMVATSEKSVEHRFPNMWSLGWGDTTVTKWLDSNTFISYKFQGDSLYIIRWGTKEFTNTSSNHQVLGNGVLSIQEFDGNYIMLGQGRGSPCWYSIILELKKGGTETSFMYPLASDLRNHRIAYLPEDSVVIQNLISKKKRSFSVCDWCESGARTLCFDSAKFEEKTFVIWYEGQYQFDDGKMQAPKMKKEIELPF